MNHISALLITLLVLDSGAVRADDPCATAFRWDVATERALFAGAAEALVAGRASASAPTVHDGHAYAIALASQPDVRFAVPPARTRVEGAYAGLVTADISEAGRYRISLDVPAWIDVVVAGTALAAADFQGGHGCSAPHKIVEFNLPAGNALVQLSASAVGTLRFSLTRSPRTGD
jgi:hypothetical protein